MAEFKPFKTFFREVFWENVNKKCDAQSTKEHFIFNKDKLPSNLELVYYIQYYRNEKKMNSIYELQACKTKLNVNLLTPPSIFRKNNSNISLYYYIMYYHVNTKYTISKCNQFDEKKSFFFNDEVSGLL